MKLIALFFATVLALALTACSDKDDANKGTQAQVEHAKAPAGEVKEAPAATKGYDPTTDEDGDC